QTVLELDVEHVDAGSVVVVGGDPQPGRLPRVVEVRVELLTDVAELCQRRRPVDRMHAERRRGEGNGNAYKRESAGGLVHGFCYSDLVPLLDRPTNAINLSAALLRPGKQCR